VISDLSDRNKRKLLTGRQQWASLPISKDDLRSRAAHPSWSHSTTPYPITQHLPEHSHSHSRDTILFNCFLFTSSLKTRLASSFRVYHQGEESHLQVRMLAQTFRFDDLVGYYVGVDDQDMCRLRRLGTVDLRVAIHPVSPTTVGLHEKQEREIGEFSWPSIAVNFDDAHGSSKYRCGKLRPPAGREKHTCSLLLS